MEHRHELTRRFLCGGVANSGIQWSALFDGEGETRSEVSGPLLGTIPVQPQLHAEHLVPKASVLGQRVGCPVNQHATSIREQF